MAMRIILQLEHNKQGYYTKTHTHSRCGTCVRTYTYWKCDYGRGMGGWMVAVGACKRR